MEEIKSAMLDFIKYQQKQQLSLRKQQMENQRRMEELRIEIQRQKLELNKSAEIKYVSSYPTRTGKIVRAIQ